MNKLIFIFTFLLCNFSSWAQGQFFYTPELLVPYTQNAPEVNSRAVVLIDFTTGALLYSKNADEEISPASLTKLMTIHLLMNEIKEGRASYDEIIPITEESWAQRQPPRSSLMFLAPGQIVTLREIILGLSISSGNDAAVALALRLAPTMEEFARLMTLEARKMGLYTTRFVEASGISEYNFTTANEFAYFCRQYILTHPQNLKDFHSVLEFAYPVAHNVAPQFRGNPRTITQGNRNGLLYDYPGVDGLKTGYIDETGYCIALTAQRDSTRFIAVLLGADTARDRDRDGRLLLNWAFDNFKTVRPVTGQLESPRLWKGKENNIEVKMAHNAVFTSPANRANTLNYAYDLIEPIQAPLADGALVGYFVISDEHGELNRVPLLTDRAYQRGNIFKRFWHSILLLFK